MDRNTTTLALKYRPHRFADVVGQKSVRRILHRMVEADMVPTGLLFSGVRGTGKTTTGRILAASLNCETEGTEPCGTCSSCVSVFTGNSLGDVIEIDAASSGNKEDIRSLQDRLAYATSGEWRVVLLDEAHSMSRDAFNALLKVLEEPPPKTIFILLTTEPNKILETVQSRLMDFEFRRITTIDITERLRYIATQEGFELPDDLLLAIAERSQGGMRDAVMTLDQISRVGVTTLDEYRDLLGEVDFGPGLVGAMLTGNPAAVADHIDAQLVRTGDAVTIANQLIGTLKDVLVLTAGGTLTAQGEAYEARKELLARLDAARAVAGLRVLWDLKTKVRTGDDPRTVLDLASVMVTEALSGPLRAPQAAPVPAVTEKPRKLTLAELRV